MSKEFTIDIEKEVLCFDIPYDFDTVKKTLKSTYKLLRERTNGRKPWKIVKETTNTITILSTGFSLHFYSDSTIAAWKNDEEYEAEPLYSGEFAISFYREPNQKSKAVVHIPESDMEAHNNDNFKEEFQNKLIGRFDTFLKYSVGWFGQFQARLPDISKWFNQGLITIDESMDLEMAEYMKLHDFVENEIKNNIEYRVRSYFT